MEKARFDPVEVIIANIIESTAIIAPIFQIQYNGVRDELGDIFAKSGRNMFTRMRKDF